LRILSYNIHHAENAAGKVDTDSLARYIGQLRPDLVALQEVDSMCHRSGRVHQVQELGRLTGMYSYFGKAMDFNGGGYGVAFLSRWPAEQVRTIALPVQPGKNREPRTAFEALVNVNGFRFKFIGTHLDHLEDETDRLMQTRFLHDLYAQEKLPFIIAGDLNAEPGSQSMQALQLICQLPEQDKQQATWPADKPAKKIDYILLSNNHRWRCKSFEVLNQQFLSDHRPVLMVLGLH
jgi:endonuclease/exonuclease/phosphatase family metal-dependent hydrolase